MPSDLLFLVCGSSKIALKTVLQSAAFGDVLLLPVSVRHVENARAWLHTLRYTFLRRITFNAVKFVNVARVFHSHSRLQQ